MWYMRVQYAHNLLNKYLCESLSVVVVPPGRTARTTTLRNVYTSEVEYLYLGAGKMISPN